MKKIILTILLIHFSILIAYSQWVQQNSGTNQNLYDIEFINEKTGWAVGDAGVVIKTTNGGTNWLNVPNPSINYNGTLFSIQPIDSNIVYFTSASDLILKTTNGGSNWDVLNYCNNCNSSITGLHFLNKDTGWFLGTNKVFRTYDGGKTLDSFYAPWFTNADIYFKDIHTGIFCGDGRVFKSTNGGMDWFDTNVPTVGVFYAFRKLAVINNYVWITGSGNPPVYRSTDFCETWEVTDTIRNYPPSVAYCISFSDENTGWVGGSFGYLYKTTNSGFNWSREATTNDNRFWGSICCFSDSIVWGTGGAGKMQHTTTGGQTLVNILLTEESTVLKFELNQNYPNPFNAETTIGFKIVEGSLYKLEIFNLLGKKLDQLINKELKAGSYKILYNAENLSSGIYIYRLSSDKEIFQKKFILLK